MVALMSGDEAPGGRHNAPPRVITAGPSKDIADRARGAGSPRFGRDIAIRDDFARPE